MDNILSRSVKKDNLFVFLSTLKIFSVQLKEEEEEVQDQDEPEEGAEGAEEGLVGGRNSGKKNGSKKPSKSQHSGYEGRYLLLAFFWLGDSVYSVQ